MKEPLQCLEMPAHPPTMESGYTDDQPKGKVRYCMRTLEIMPKPAPSDNDIVHKMHPVNIKIIESPCQIQIVTRIDKAKSQIVSQNSINPSSYQNPTPLDS